MPFAHRQGLQLGRKEYTLTPVPHGKASIHVWVHMCVAFACACVYRGRLEWNTSSRRFWWHHGSFTVTRLLHTSFTVIKGTMTLGSKAWSMWDPARHFHSRNFNPSQSQLSSEELKGLYPSLLSHAVQCTAKQWPQQPRWNQGDGLAHSFHPSLLFSHTRVRSMSTRTWGGSMGNWLLNWWTKNFCLSHTEYHKTSTKIKFITLK